jgi:hypothetical protein
MRQILHIIFVLTIGLVALAQDATPAQSQLTQVPPKPTCHWIFNSGPCNDLWRAYNQALAQRQREELQLYVNKQKEIASSQATAPLQQQIADLDKQVADLSKLGTEQQEQIKKLQEQINSDAAVALQASSDAHKEGLEFGVEIGAGSVLTLVMLIFAIKKFTVNNKKPLARGASA